MKKLADFILLILVISVGLFLMANFVTASFWQRPDEREREVTRPSPAPTIERDRLPTVEPTRPFIPTETPAPTATPPIVQATPTKRPEDRIGGNDNGRGEDRGEHEEEEEKQQDILIEGPSVLALSDTSSGDLAVSDIMLLTGVLCLLLYAKSKLSAKNLR